MRVLLYVMCLVMAACWVSVPAFAQSESVLRDAAGNERLLQSCSNKQVTCSTGSVISVPQCSYFSRAYICGHCDGHKSEAQLCEAEEAKTKNWMSRYASRALQSLTVPGAHDGLMANVTFPDAFNDCTTGANRFNSRTQILGVANMLAAGVRLFDIRPMVDYSKSEPRIYSHHGFFAGPKFVGCLGYRLENTLDTIARYLEAHPTEVVTLEITHMHNVMWVDPALGGTASLDDEKVIRDLFLRYLGDYMIKGSDLRSVLQTPLSQLTSGGRGGVLVIFETYNADKTVFLAKDGFYKKDSGVFYDSYSNTNDIGVLRNGGKNNAWEAGKPLRKGQRVEAREASKSDPARFVYVDWTLTQSKPQGVACGAVSATSLVAVWALRSYAACKAAGGSVESMAETANSDVLSGRFYDDYVQNGYPPNVVSLDYVSGALSEEIIKLNDLPRR